jgi:hypothetical protein
MNTTKQIKADTIAALQAMHDIIKAKLNAMRAENNGLGWRNHSDPIKAQVWEQTMDDIMYVGTLLHNARLPGACYINSEFVRAKVSRSL